MTVKKQLKARIRERMAKTGESYTTARLHIAGRTGPAEEHGWRFLGGLEPSSSAIANVLANGGVNVGEPLVFLAGGGIGAGYILWEFKRHDAVHLVIGFRNQWQYADRWMGKTLGRLGVRHSVHSTSGAKGAAKRLTEELAAGRPCVILPDLYHLGYWNLPEHLDGHGGHPVVAYRGDETAVAIDDRGQAPLLVPRERVDAARARVSSYKNLLWVLDPEPLGEGVLAQAVLEGLRDCASHLSAASDSFSLPAWRKWGRLMTDTRNAKAWPKVFADGSGLGGALLSAWEGIEQVGAEGGHLRGLFADGLTEAATLLDRPDLNGLAEEFRRIGGLWHELAEHLLPADVPEFARVRDLTAAIRESVAAEGTTPDAERERAEYARELEELRAAVDADAPVGEPAALFAEVGERLGEIYTAEQAAIDHLSNLVR